MKYFTPDLYLRFNSRERREMEQAHEEWETAIKRYGEHLDGIGSKMTESVRELARELRLHDACYLGLSLMPSLDTEAYLGVLMTKQKATYHFLVYLLAQEPLIQEVEQPWPFSKAEVHWLYDEFSLDADGRQQHEVLLSDGRVIKLNFHDLQLFKHEFGGRLAVA